MLFGVLLETLGASILGNTLSGKGVMKDGKSIVRAGRGYHKMDQMDKKL